MAEIAAKCNENGRGKYLDALGPCFFLCKLVGTVFLYLTQRKLSVVSVMTNYSHCMRAQLADGHVMLDVFFSTTVTEIQPYVISTFCLDVS